MKRRRQLFHDLHSFADTACFFRCNCTPDIWSTMNQEQAKNLVKLQTHLIRQCVCKHCRDEKHLISLALIYLNQRLSVQDWQLIRQYDGMQPFEELICEFSENVLETFFHGVWFGKCVKTIQYWIKRYGIDIENQRQDAEDYVKNKLAKDNFARFRSYKQEGTASFTTYISIIIRNLLIDYLRKKMPETETLKVIESDNGYVDKTITDNTVESYEQEYLEAISQWFFAGSEPQKTTIQWLARQAA